MCRGSQRSGRVVKTEGTESTAQSLSTHVEHEDGTERHVKDGAKGRGKGQRIKGRRRTVVAQPSSQ